MQVLEVARPNRQVRRRFGKTDVIDAIAAGRAVLSDEATGAPKGQDGRVEPLRTLKAVQRSGNKARPLGRTVLLATCADFPIKPDDGGGRRRLGWLAAVVLTVDAMLANHPDRVRPVEKPPSAALPSRGVLALAPMRADDLAVFAVAAIRHDPAPGWSSLALTHRQQSGAVVR